MPTKVWLRYADLKDRRIVNSWAQLSSLVKNQGFPTGRLLGPQTRVWGDDEIDGWLAARPTAPGLLRGFAKANVEAKQAREAREALAANGGEACGPAASPEAAPAAPPASEASIEPVVPPPRKRGRPRKIKPEPQSRGQFELRPIEAATPPPSAGPQRSRRRRAPGAPKPALLTD
jgi:hypothetical protein